MLSPAVDILDLDGDHVRGWLELTLPPAIHQPNWAAVFVGEGGRIEHAIASGQGAIDTAGLTLPSMSHGSIRALRRRLNVGLLIALGPGAMAELIADIDRRLSLEQDYAAQWITVLSALRRSHKAGKIAADPPLLELIPPLSAEAMQRTFELLVPDRSALCAYVIDEAAGRIHASVIGVVSGGDFEVLTTHQGLVDAQSAEQLARGWKNHYRRTLALIDERYATPSLGVFATRAAWYRVLTGPADQLTRELAAGAIVFDPAPPWLRGLLGGAQLAVFAGGAARSLARLVPARARQAGLDLAQSAQDRLKQSGAHPFALLGFDPLELWRDVRAYYQPR